MYLGQSFIVKKFWSELYIYHRHWGTEWKKELSMSKNIYNHVYKKIQLSLYLIDYVKKVIDEKLCGGGESVVWKVFTPLASYRRHLLTLTAANNVILVKYQSDLKRSGAK